MINGQVEIFHIGNDYHIKAKGLDGKVVTLFISSSRLRAEGVQEYVQGMRAYGMRSLTTYLGSFSEKGE